MMFQLKTLSHRNCKSTHKNIIVIGFSMTIIVAILLTLSSYIGPDSLDESPYGYLGSHLKHPARVCVCVCVCVRARTHECVHEQGSLAARALHLALCCGVCRLLCIQPAVHSINICGLSDVILRATPLREATPQHLYSSGCT